jgi:hypothetical protein
MCATIKQSNQIAIAIAAIATTVAIESPTQINIDLDMHRVTSLVTTSLGKQT